MMSRWCDQSIPDESHSAFSSGPLEVAVLFGTLVAETILASVHVRAHKQAGHMDASDLIKALQNTLARRGAVHIWKVTERPWLTTLAPILINFSRRPVSDHGSAVFGI